MITLLLACQLAAVASVVGLALAAVAFAWAAETFTRLREHRHHTRN